jgi:hypothetical protein
LAPLLSVPDDKGLIAHRAVAGLLHEPYLSP